MDSKGTSDFYFTPSSQCNSFMVDVSNSGRPNSSLRPLIFMEDKEWINTGDDDDVSSSAAMHGNASSPHSSDPQAAQLEDEFRQFLVERGTYKELERTASRVLLKLLQAKRADGSPLFVLNKEEVSSTENNCRRHTSGKSALSQNFTNESIPPSLKKSAKKRILLSTGTKSDGCSKNQGKESKSQNNCRTLEHKRTMIPSIPVEWLDQTSSQGSAGCSGQQTDTSRILSDILQSAFISLNRQTRIEMHLSNQLGIIVKPPIESTK